ncbi:branched-chain amino acid ABC transporter permease [Rhodoligotrophos defluvii]|uniref:branched-chain amino acid ABC transporter permease n=1 Tax=Rhodoligotrophos defluvii TaxID=2561934 RepID=UPI0010C985EE|nr:branched-chain amino acid ABC transporter permease [Rhodoligotrophos defluvii]
MLYLQLFVVGIQTGALYALAAAGFALIFGATRTFHIAHGATYVLAGYSFLAGLAMGWHWLLAVLLALLVATLFGILIEKYVYKPIQRHRGGFFTVFVASFGVLIAVQSIIELTFGRGFQSISSPLTRSQELLPGLFVAPVFWVVSLLAILCFLAFGFILGRTRPGIALRALSDNPELLRSFGLSANRLSLLAFGLGSALVAPAAVLGIATTGLQASSGTHIMLISSAATIVGGIGSVRGAIVAGLLLGVAESLVVALVNTQWSEAAAFIVLFAFLLVKPSGLFGVRVAR